MERLISKFNLYDILAMIAIGCILLFDIHLNGCSQISLFIKETSLLTGFMLLAIAYGLGIINHQITDILTGKLRWVLNTRLVKKYICNHQQRHFLHEQTKKLLNSKKMDENEMMDKYYEAYNTAIIYHPQTAVLTLEKQLVLLRNLAIPMSWMAYVSMSMEGFCCKIAVLFGIVLVLAITTIFRTKKQVALVWEEYEVVKQLGLDKK